MAGVAATLKDRVPTVLWATAAGLGGCLLWAYWPTLAALVNRWATDPQATYGFIVPLFAAIVLWTRRASFPAGAWTLEPSGFVLFAAAALIRLGGTYVHIDWFDGFSLLLSLIGLCWLVGGWQRTLWAWPGWVLLLFVLPLPYQAEIALAGPLQRAATVASCYTLQTLGYPALAEGNVIVLDELRIGVEQACNGLGMLASFFALSTAFAFVMRDRPWYEKVVVFLSAIPIGLVVNLVRITVMAWAHRTFSPALADALFHDYAGWLMLPLAVAILWLEWQLLRRLLVDKAADRPVAVLMPREISIRAGSVSGGILKNS